MFLHTKMPHRGVQYEVIIWHENEIESNIRISAYIPYYYLIFDEPRK